MTNIPILCYYGKRKISSFELLSQIVSILQIFTVEVGSYTSKIPFYQIHFDIQE